MAAGGGTEAWNQGEAAAGLLVGGFRVSPGNAMGRLGGLPACFAEMLADGGSEPRVADRRPGPLVALRARRDAPPPANLSAFAEAYSTSLLMPLAYGAAGGEYWIVCDGPPGPSVPEAAAGRPLAESELIGAVLKPLALALQRLHAVGLTHRGIRAGNLFRIGSGTRVALGPGWTTPPAFEQDAVHEPADSAVCHPAMRGPGSPADDIYALGVLLLELALGRRPLAELDADEVVLRKLDQGSFTALAGGEPLPPVLVPVLRAMLCDTADGRPSAASLAERGAAAERPKPPRPAPRSHRKLQVGRFEVSGARALGFALSRHPNEAMGALRDGTVTRWLARSLDQPALAAQVEAGLRAAEERPFSSGDAAAMQRVSLLLDPEAPLFWQEQFLWPDGIPFLLAAQLGGTAPELSVTELVRSGALRWWGLHGSRGGSATMDAIDRHLARIGRNAPPALRSTALAYATNKLLPCASPLLSTEWVLDGPGLLAALERRRPARGRDRLLDGQMLAMLIARSEDDAEPADGSGDWAVPADADEILLDLKLLGQVQKRLAARPGASGGSAGQRPGASPWLAAEFLPSATGLVNNWPGRDRRQRRRTELEAAARAGNLVGMLDACCNRAALAQEAAAFEAARTRIRTLRRERDPEHDGQGTGRTLAAARTIAGAASPLAGMLALLVAAVAVMVPA